jgi:predicted DCC family thiol-disulfide oxidoreductase YuxK
MKLESMTGFQFALCRVILGVYLLIHFLTLMPNAVELLSNAGMFSDASILPTWVSLPNVFAISDSPLAVQAIIGISVVLCICLSIGYRRRWAAIALWLIWASIFNRNPLISNPSIPFIGLLLLVCAVLPSGEPASRDPAVLDWAPPSWLSRALLLTLMLGYTVSGIHKLTAPSWVDGTALTHVLELPIARDIWLRSFVLALPLPLLKFATWSALAMEVLALPLTFLPATRRWVWLGLLAMNLGILCVIDFADLTFGVLVFHIFAFHREWLPGRKWATANPVIFFDGVCTLCNHTVDFVIAEDEDQTFHFAPVQGQAAQDIEEESVRQGTSMALLDGEKLYTKSDAVLAVAAGLGGLWRVLSWSRVIPRPIRNAVYFLVQKNRYSVFGQQETCRLPTPQERARFLD